MQNGWIKLHRSIIDWEWYSDINTCRLFIHLLAIANHKDKKWRGILIKKGEKLTSQIKLSEETGLSRQQVRTSLNKLKSTNDITIVSTAQSTVVSIVNWDKYQQETSEATNEQPTDNQRVTTNKNDKKEKNVITTTPAKPKYEENDLDFAQKAFEEILKHAPDFKRPNLNSWAEIVRKMRELDNRSLDEMATAWVWIRNDHFWSTNILSMAKFREKYDQIKLKMTSEVRPNENTSRPDNSAAGRVRANVQRELDEIEQQISRQSEGGAPLAIDDQSVWSPMD